MPEIALIEAAVLAGMLVLGAVLGWFSRSGRCTKEKNAANAGWQEQLESRRTEQDRLAGQNQSLMEQISQYQASMKDSNLRAKELSDSLKEAFERRDALQNQLKEIRGNLEVAVAQQKKLETDAQNRDSRDDISLKAIRERDSKIFKLSRELTEWQNRVPPLVERFRKRDLEAQEIEVNLQQARERVAALEAVTGADDTRIEPVDPNSLADGLNASNDPLDDESGEFETELVDQNTSYNESIRESDESPIDSDASGEFDAGDTPEQPYMALDDDEQTPQADALVNDSEAGDSDEQTPQADALVNDSELSDDEGQVLEADALVNDSELSDDDGQVLEADALVNDSELSDDAADDLKMIKGVGPAIERTLNDFGIWRFNQIAEMSEYDIDRVAQQLRGFRSRMYREDWVGQARTLQYQRNTDLV